VLVSADYVGNCSGQFLSYAALLARQGVLRRVVVDECHVAITADSWRAALRRLKDIRLLPCQQVLLTATLPPSQESQLCETMLMPGATVLRAETTQRPGTCYAVVRCQRRVELQERTVRLARTLIDEAKCLPCAPLPPLQDIESAAKGIIYCRSKPLCDTLADALGCPAYYADMEASRTEVLKTWRLLGGLIVSTSALSVGVNIPRVLFTLHVERPWGMVDFVQESGRMRGEGKSVIVLVQPPQAQEKPHEQHEQHEQEMNDSEAMAAFVRTTGCRRKVMSQYMDGKQLSCAQLQARAAVEVAACDNCEEQQRGGRRGWQNDQAIQAVQEQAVRAKLDELAQSICPYCWAIVHEIFDGRPSEGGELARQEQEAAMHSLWQCPRVQDIAEAEEVRRRIWYSRDVHTCRKCSIMDYLCTRENSRGSSSRQQDCAWPNVVVPLLSGLRAAAEAKAMLESDDASARTRTTLGRVGYQEKDSCRAGFSKWIGKQYTGRRVFGRVVGNGVAAVVEAILKEKN
jgi:hypothetical protein